MLRKAICVGTNYPGTPHQLAGCVNDAHDWAAFFQSNNFAVDTLLDAQATKAGMLAALTNLVHALAAGDVGAFTFSGHGTWVPDADGDEPDGRDECLCPTDMGDDGRNLLLDDEIRLALNELAPGARLLFVTDSCFSGTVYRFADPGPLTGRARFLPPSQFIKDPRLLARMDRAFGQNAAKSDAPLPGVVHMSACRDTEYANDATFGGRPNGAFSYFALAAFRSAAKRGLTYQQTWEAVRQRLPSWQYRQTPLLNAPPGLRGTVVF